MARSVILVLLIACVALACTDEARAPNEAAGAFDASVTYEVNPPTIPEGTTPRAILTNEGPASIEYGNFYRLKRIEDGVWVAVEQPDDAEIMCAFTSEAYILAPGDSKSHSISVCDEKGEDMVLKPGRYRLFKTVRIVDPRDTTVFQKLRVRADFEIVDH